jgi:hypothetical protein
VFSISNLYSHRPTWSVYFFKGIFFPPPFPSVDRENRPGETLTDSSLQRPERALQGKVIEKREEPVVAPLSVSSSPAAKEIVPPQPAAKQSRLQPVAVVSVYDR